MVITRQTLIGAVIGVGVTAAGYYVYRKNQDKIDNYLRAHGLEIPVNENKPLAKMSLEELSILKEKVEDIIAEQEQKAEEEKEAVAAAIHTAKGKAKKA